MSVKAYTLNEFEVEETRLFDLWEDYFFLEILGQYSDAQDQVRDEEMGYFVLNIEQFKDLEKDWETRFNGLSPLKIERAHKILEKIRQKFLEGSELIEFYYETSGEPWPENYQHITEFNLENELNISKLENKVSIWDKYMEYSDYIPVIKLLLKQKICQLEEIAELLKNCQNIKESISVFKSYVNVEDSEKFSKEVLNIMAYNLVLRLQENIQVYGKLTSSKVYMVKNIKITDTPIFNVLEPFTLSLSRKYCNKKFPKLPSHDYGIFTIDLDCFKQFKKAWENNEAIRTKNADLEVDVINQIKKISTQLKKNDAILRNGKIMFYFE